MKLYGINLNERLSEWMNEWRIWDCWTFDPVDLWICACQRLNSNFKSTDRVHSNPFAVIYKVQNTIYILTTTTNIRNERHHSQPANHIWIKLLRNILNIMLTTHHLHNHHHHGSTLVELDKVTNLNTVIDIWFVLLST